MGDDGRAAQEGGDVCGDVGEIGRVVDLALRYAGELPNESRQPPSGVDERLIFANVAARAEPNRADFDNGVGAAVQPCGFEIERDPFAQARERWIYVGGLPSVKRQMFVKIIPQRGAAASGWRLDIFAVLP